MLMLLAVPWLDGLPVWRSFLIDGLLLLAVATFATIVGGFV